jgi:hypothetical protein
MKKVSSIRFQAQRFLLFIIPLAILCNFNNSGAAQHTTTAAIDKVATTNDQIIAVAETFPTLRSAAISTSSQTTTPSSIPALIPIATFKPYPRLALTAAASDNAIINAQLLVPLYQDQAREQLIYGIAASNKAINHHNQSRPWTIGGGVGYRRITNDQIYGSYLMIEHNRSASNDGFTIVNLGAEILSDSWDFHLNTYWPHPLTHSTTKNGYASDFQVYDYINRDVGHSVGNSIYDRIASQTTHISAARGLDIRIGHAIPSFEQAKVYLGSYHFNVRNIGAINGIMAKLTYSPHNNVVFEFTNTYDNRQHYQTMLGIKFVFGGNYSQEEKNRLGIVSRMMDFPERGFINTISPIIAQKDAVQVHLSNNPPQRIRDNIWYFKKSSPSAPSNQHNNNANNNNGKNSVPQGDGTYENPFHDFHQTHFNHILQKQNQPQQQFATPFPSLFFAPGNYSFNEFSGHLGSTKQPHTFYLPPGWGLYGRTHDYRAPATGELRPTFTGALDLFNPATTPIDSQNQHHQHQQYQQQLNNIIDSVNFLYTAANGNIDGIIRIENLHNAILRNIAVGANNATMGYRIGIWSSQSTLDLHSVKEINAYSNNRHDRVTGILALNGSIINFVDGTNYINGTILATQGTGDNIYAAGISANDSTINFLGGQNHVSGAITGNSKVNRMISLGSYGIDLVNSTINFGRANKSNNDSNHDNNSRNNAYPHQPSSPPFASSNGNSSHNFSLSTAIDSNISGVIGDNTWLNAAGIRSNNSNINFLAGNNNITANLILTPTTPMWVTATASGILTKNGNNQIQFNNANGLSSIKGNLVLTGDTKENSGVSADGITIDGASNTIISFISGSNNIFGDAHIALKQNTESGFWNSAHGIYINTRDKNLNAIINFAGGNNAVEGALVFTGNGDNIYPDFNRAAGIRITQTGSDNFKAAIKFSGGVNVIGGTIILPKQHSNLSGNINASGISLNDRGTINIDFLGGTNLLLGKITTAMLNQQEPLNFVSSGMYINAEDDADITINFCNGNNMLSGYVNSQAELGSANTTIEAAGIYANRGAAMINLAGGTNVFQAIAESTIENMPHMRNAEDIRNAANIKNIKNQRSSANNNRVYGIILKDPQTQYGKQYSNQHSKYTINFNGGNNRIYVHSPVGWEYYGLFTETKDSANFYHNGNGITKINELNDNRLLDIGYGGPANNGSNTLNNHTSSNADNYGAKIKWGDEKIDWR